MHLLLVLFLYAATFVGPVFSLPLPSFVLAIRRPQFPGGPPPQPGDGSPGSGPGGNREYIISASNEASESQH